MEFQYKRHHIRVEAKKLGAHWQAHIWLDGHHKLLASQFSSEAEAITGGEAYAKLLADAPASSQPFDIEENGLLKLFDGGKEHSSGDLECKACDEGFPKPHHDEVMRAQGQSCEGLIHCETGPWHGVGNSVADVFYKCDACGETEL